MPILLSSKSNGISFDPEAVRVMADAFDAASRLLVNISEASRSTADRIIDEATRGKRDFERLSEASEAAPGPKNHKLERSIAMARTVLIFALNMTLTVTGLGLIVYLSLPN